MANPPTVLLSGFADESAIGKTAVEQLATCAGVGLQYYSLRFVDVGGGVKNVMKLDESEIEKLLELHRVYDMKVATLGSPIGKVKLLDREDGSSNAFIPFEKYLADDVVRAIRLAQRFDTRLLRGFSFYPPKGDDPEPYFAMAIDRLGQIVDVCRKEGVVYGLEIEANLMGRDGESIRRLADGIHDPSLVTIYDGGNLACQNLPANRCFEEYVKMRPSLGWMHVKDYRIDPGLKWEGHVDEERLKNFVPCDEGDSGYAAVLRDFRDAVPPVEERMKKLGAPGVFLDLEPHLKGGGQFGGYSGPDGFGVALRALCRVLDGAGVAYHLRDFASLKRPR